MTDPVKGIETYGIYGVIETLTGKVAWKIKMPILSSSGMLVAGDLVFFA